MNRRKPWVLMALLLCLSMFLASTSWAQSLATAKIIGFFLELDGVDCGIIQDVTGGAPVLQASTQTSSTGATNASRLKYEDIKFSFAIGLSRYFYTSVQDHLSGRNVLHSGSIVALNEVNREISRLSFTGGSIRELFFPVMSGSSSKATWFKLSISPTAVQRTFTPASIPFQNWRNPLATRTEQRLPSDSFQLQIPGLENDCQKVVVIETLLPNQRSEVLLGGDATTVVDNRHRLIIIFAPLGTTELFNWQEDFIVRGNNDDTKRRQGTLSHLITPTGVRTPIPSFVLTYRKLGISRLTSFIHLDPDTPALFWRAEMDMERIEINFDGMVSRFDTTSVGTSPAQPTTLKTSTSPAPAKTEPTSKVAAPVKELTKARLVQLLVTPNVTRMELRDSLQFKAVALYQDKTTQEVTTQVEWYSGDYSVIEVFKDGLATAKSPGKAEVFATYQGIEGQSDQIIVFDPSKVKEGRIVQIFVTPNTLTLKPRDSYQFMATALFSDKTIMDITDKVEWYAGDYTIVEVFEDGLATAKKPGKTTIFATYKEIEGESEEITVLGTK